MTAPCAPAPGLRRFLTPREPRPERCGLCAAPLGGARHRHLVDTAHHALVCACPDCFLPLASPGADGRFRAVPDRRLTDPGHRLDDRAWDALRIPVQVAFFFRSTRLDRLVAFYPSPAGATESELDPETFSAVLGGSRLAALLQPDVEALLLRRTPDGCACHLVPVDVCYELVGRMRRLWRGFDGGSEARAELDAFFARLGKESRPLPEEAGRPVPPDNHDPEEPAA